MSEWPFSQAHRPVVVAHRGASAELPREHAGGLRAAVDAGRRRGRVRRPGDRRRARRSSCTTTRVDRTTDGAATARRTALDGVRGLRAGGGTGTDGRGCPRGLLSGRCAAVDRDQSIPGDAGGGERAVDEALPRPRRGRVRGARGAVSRSTRCRSRHARRSRPTGSTGLLDERRRWACRCGGRRRDRRPRVRAAVRAAGAGGRSAAVAAPTTAGCASGRGSPTIRTTRSALAGLGVDAIATNDPAAIVAACSDRA